MRLILRNLVDQSIQSLSFEDFETFQNIINQFHLIKLPTTASLITSEEKINSQELSKLKLILESLYINFIRIYSKN